jgi:uncharacterized cupin superfamily protein
MVVVNVDDDNWDLDEQHGDFGGRDAWVGARLGSELIGGTLYEIDAGKKLCPYHLHHASEEWLIVLRGRPTLRTPDGERDLEEGDVACFLRGSSGAHQVLNRSAAPARILMLSTKILPDVVEDPDSRKVGARDARGAPLFLGRPGPMLDYWDGED